MVIMNNEWDDGQTVADMSALQEQREHVDMSPEDRRMYIFGAMGAAALIGLVFLVAAFIVILLMFIIW